MASSTLSSRCTVRTTSGLLTCQSSLCSLLHTRWVSVESLGG